MLLIGCHFASNWELKQAIYTWFTAQSRILFFEGIQKLVQCLD